MIISLQNVTKIFNRNRPDEFVALEDVSLTLNSQKATVFKGPSGSGKTTLLSLIGCMAKPTMGRVVVDNREVTSLPDRFLTDVRRRTFGFIFQQFQLIRGITAIENVMLPAYTTGISFADMRTRAKSLLGMLGLAKKETSKIEWLSGGEAQRVAIARALMNDPAIIIADEPTAHLDSKIALEFLNYMEQLKADGKTLLFASHDPLVYESPMIDDMVEMRDGKVLDSGSKP